MFEKYAITVITCIIAIGAGIIAGNGAVYFFQRIADNQRLL